MATAKNKLSTDFQSAINCVPERSLLGAFGKQHHDYDHDVFNSAGSTLATPHFGPENGVHLNAVATNLGNEESQSSREDARDSDRRSLGSETADRGFRVFKLDTSNIRAWEPDRNDMDGALLENIDHIKPSRSEEDILYEVLLKLGLDLCVPIETRNIVGKSVHSIGAGTLITCLEEKITPGGGRAAGPWYRRVARRAGTRRRQHRDLPRQCVRR